MKTRFFLISFLLSVSPLFCEEKDLKQLHHTAEAAMGAQNFSAAKEAYERLLEKVTPPTSFSRRHRVDWATYVDLVTRLAHTYLALGEYEKGETLLASLLERKMPEEFIPSVKLLQSRFHCSQQSPGDAYLLMKETALQSPMEDWKGEDRSLFLSLEYVLNAHYDSLLQRAKRFFTAGNYSHAKEMYQELIEAIEKGYYPKASMENSLIKKKVLYRLAEANFYLADYEKTLTLIPEISQAEDKIDRQLLYLAAMAYQEKHAYEKALDYFDSYLRSGQKEELPHYEHALFEMGHGYYQSGQFAEAQRYFEKLYKTTSKREKPFFLGTIYLAKIHLKDRLPRLAESILSTASKQLPSKDPLQYEIAYLRGSAAFDAGNYVRAAEFFELSFPAPPISGNWCHDALFRLGWCYSKLGDDCRKAKHVRELLISKAEAIFRRLMHTEEHERACLALGKLYLLRFEQTGEESFLSKMEIFLAKESPTFSLEGQLHSLLLRASSKTDYEQRERILRKATDPLYVASPSYAEAWYYRGLNHFQEGLSKKENQNPFFDKAIEAFEKALSVVEHQDPRKVADLLKWEAHATFYRNSTYASLEACEKLLNQFPISLQEKESILYLRGLVACRLSDENSLAIAKSSLKLVSSLFPEGLYADAALYLLGTLHYQQEEFQEAKEAFLALGEKYPTSIWAGKGLFWAAESAEKMGEETQFIRKQVFEKYPYSEFADEAYFRFFPLEAYSLGEKEAMTHLKEFFFRFPDSPLNIAAFYYMGVHALSKEEGKEYFENCLASFEGASKKNHRIPSPLIYFRYRSLVELAQLHLNNGDFESLEKSFSLLQGIIHEFETPGHPLAAEVQDKITYPSLHEESEFLLALAYLKAGKPQKTQEIFAKMLSHYASAGIRSGYYLARVWQEQGTLALECSDTETALRCFKMAEECGKGHFSGDQKLSLWILQSDCYRKRNEFDAAMKMLSQVINEDIASPLRVKAMILRAEVYELQGRYELAIRQLQAVTKKGGEWALEAKEKLKGQYGLD